MALVLKDRVKESSSSSGTGSITLGGAFPGYQTFNAAIANGSTVYYTIHNLVSGYDTEWEVGVGTFTSPATLSRDTVLSSSTGSLINFTSGTAGLEVFVTQPAEEAVYINQATGLVEAFGNGTNTIAFTNINASNVVMVSGTISTNASNNTDITNKAYVDGVAATGLSYHTAVQVATTQSLAAQTGGTVTYNQPGGAGNGVGATITLSVALTTLDGYSLSNTNRVLVKDETNQTYNGVYTWATGGTVLTRATDADTYGKNPNQLSLNDYFYVQNGNTNKGTAWVVDDPAGTITFGTSNINFALFSSSQVYAAGTGLNLSNLTFSIANTAVTANTYGNDGAVGQFTVNAQGQITNAATVSVNASAISVGTLANARTTASNANGASTIVSRDANGSFTANVITATDVNSTNVTATTVSATTGSFTNVSGNGAAISAINASNISSGTIANARTTANTSNSASTIVVRDANGAFEAGNVTAANFIGAGATITSINASNISSGTIANARTTAASANGASTIVSRDAGGNFSANMITADITGNGSALTAINASNISSGTIANARTTASSANGASTIVLRDTNGSFDANVVNATNLSGGGTSITSMNASNLSAGTVASARISGSYTGITGVGTVTAGTWNGNVITTTYGGTNSSGTATAGGIAYGNGTAILVTSAGTAGQVLTSNATAAPTWTTAASANGASTIVQRDAGGNFSAATITATTFSGAHSGDGSALSAINASNISSGTVATARLATGTANSSTYLRGDQTWAVLTAPNNGTLTMNTSGTGLSGSQTFTADQASNATFTVTSNANSSNGASTIVARDSGGNFSANTITANLTGNASGSAATFTSTSQNSQFNSVGVGTAGSGTAGEIRATNNITAYYSDERLKTKVGNIDNALDKVCQIETMLYHANEVAVALGYDASIIEPGVTAQSVQKVQPEVVVPAPIDDKYLTVRYEKLLPLLIEAIKELKAEVDALKGK